MKQFIAVVALMLAVSHAGAGELEDFNAQIEVFASHGRSALAFLRLRDADRIAAELGEMRNTWSDMVARFGKDPPEPYRDNPQFKTMLVDVPVRLVGTELVMSLGRADGVRTALIDIRKSLSVMRRASKAEVLADCILDANEAFAAVARQIDTSVPENSSPTGGSDAEITNYVATLRRCDSMAPDTIRSRPAFRRNIDGAIGAATTSAERTRRP